VHKALCRDPHYKASRTATWSVHGQNVFAASKNDVLSAAPMKRRDFINQAKTWTWKEGTRRMCTVDMRGWMLRSPLGLMNKISSYGGRHVACCGCWRQRPGDEHDLTIAISSCCYCAVCIDSKITYLATSSFSWFFPHYLNNYMNVWACSSQDNIADRQTGRQPEVQWNTEVH